MWAVNIVYKQDWGLLFHVTYMRSLLIALKHYLVRKTLILRTTHARTQYLLI